MRDDHHEADDHRLSVELHVEVGHRVPGGPRAVGDHHEQNARLVPDDLHEGGVVHERVFHREAIYLRYFEAHAALGYRPLCEAVLAACQSNRDRGECCDVVRVARLVRRLQRNRVVVREEPNDSRERSARRRRKPDPVRVVPTSAHPEIPKNLVDVAFWTNPAYVRMIQNVPDELNRVAKYPNRLPDDPTSPVRCWTGYDFARFGLAKIGEEIFIGRVEVSASSDVDLGQELYWGFRWRRNAEHSSNGIPRSPDARCGFGFRFGLRHFAFGGNRRRIDDGPLRCFVIELLDGRFFGGRRRCCFAV